MSILRQLSCSTKKAYPYVFPVTCANWFSTLSPLLPDHDEDTNQNGQTEQHWNFGQEEGSSSLDFYTSSPVSSSSKLILRDFIQNSLYHPVSRASLISFQKVDRIIMTDSSQRIHSHGTPSLDCVITDSSNDS
jgi:hypothetical protein